MHSFTMISSALAALATGFAPPRLFTPTTSGEVTALPLHTAAGGGSIFYPIDFGADPTSANDSTKHCRLPSTPRSQA